MTRATLIVLVLLAGCARDDSPQGQCRRQANENPAVKDLIIKGVGNPQFEKEHETELERAKRDAELACLRPLGLAPAGGVERRRP